MLGPVRALHAPDMGEPQISKLSSIRKPDNTKVCGGTIESEIEDHKPVFPGMYIVTISAIPALY